MNQDYQNITGARGIFYSGQVAGLSERMEIEQVGLGRNANSTTGLNRKVSRLKQFCAEGIKRKYFKNQLPRYQAVFKTGSDNGIAVNIFSRSVVLYGKLEFKKDECLRLLKNDGIDVNHINEPQVKTKNKIPMIWAAEKGYRNIVQALIKAGGDVNVKDGDGHTPLCFAIFEKCLPVVELLLKENIDWEHFKNHCKSVSLNAITTGKIEVVKLLIEKDVYCSLRVNGWSALEWAEKSGQTGIAYEIKKANYSIREE